MKKYVSISELSKELNLVNPTTKKPLNYVLRFWEQKLILLIRTGSVD